MCLFIHPQQMLYLFNIVTENDMDTLDFFADDSERDDVVG
jgi:hypothetical protein